MAKNQIAKKVYSEDGSSVAFNFADEVSVLAELSSFPTDIQTRFAQYGMSQKLGDKYSGAKSPADARDELALIITQLQNGDWRAASEAAGPKAGKTVRAFFRVCEVNAKWAMKHYGLKEVTIESIRDLYATFEKQMKSEVGKSPEVVTMLATIALEEAQSNSAPSLMG